MINYAHRGASTYAPENTMASFRMGIAMGANGIETDVQRTRDGVLVLFHDNKVERILLKPGRIADYTLKELRGFDFGGFLSRKFVGEPIVTLDEFLDSFAAMPLHFAIELKVADVERDTIDRIFQAGCASRTVVTSFEMEYLIAARRYREDIRLGYLSEEPITDELLTRLERQRIGQVCPRVEGLTKEQVEMAKARGFSVRGWGVRDVELMRHAIACGVDGMTVNFPDLLTRELGGKYI